MQKKIISYFIVGILTLCSLSSASLAHAASLSLAGTQDTATGLVAVDVLLDTGAQRVNAVSGTLHIEGAKLSFYSFDETQSLVSAWVERPHMTSDDTLSFAGVITGGFSELRNQFSGFPLVPTVVHLQFVPLEEGTVMISLSDGQLLANDGKGTEVPLIATPTLVLDVVRRADAHLSDTTAPESFTPILAKSDALFNGSYFVTFDTRDAGTGIDHYEIQEGEDGRWVQATSPYVVEDQTLRKKITVAAVDRAGNRTLAVVSKISLSETTLSLVIIGLFIASLLILWVVLRRYGWGVQFGKQKND